MAMAKFSALMMSTTTKAMKMMMMMICNAIVRVWPDATGYCYRVEVIRCLNTTVTLLDENLIIDIHRSEPFQVSSM